MRVLFWGTPEFAVSALRAIVGEGHEVVGVVTQPDRPAGRGRAVKPSPVKAWALEEGYPVLTPERPEGESFLQELSALKPDISVVAAYGHILRPQVLELPPQGSVNIHASLLPELRGAAPVNWAIIRGHEISGVSIMRMEEGLDSGPVLLRVEEEMGDQVTASELYAYLAEAGALAVVAALALIEGGVAEEEEQDHEKATYAPKIDRNTARLDWELEASAVGRWIRGMDAVPGAWSILDGHPVKLFWPQADDRDPDGGDPGLILDADPAKGLRVSAGRGVVTIGEVQPEGKKRMAAADWIRGRGCEPGQRFV
jgi:methionyl-tRNA formyltransferase